MPVWAKGKANGLKNRRVQKTIEGSIPSTGTSAGLPCCRNRYEVVNAASASLATLVVEWDRGTRKRPFCITPVASVAGCGAPGLDGLSLIFGSDEGSGAPAL